jgi:hypothetical protein
MVRSESLDSWVRSHTGGIKRPLRPDIAATLQRVASTAKTTITIRETTIDQLRGLMKNELAVGMMLAKHALQCGVPRIVSRDTAMARQAYDTIIRLSEHVTAPGIQPKGFAAELDQLRAALRKLGEKI